MAENDNSDEIPADLAHHFLLAICTHPGVGVCFRDQGWYPRADSNDNLVYNDPTVGHHAGRIYNKILANIVRLLRVSEDARQQELAFRNLEACPELVAKWVVELNFSVICSSTVVIGRRPPWPLNHGCRQDGSRT